MHMGAAFKVATLAILGTGAGQLVEDHSISLATLGGIALVALTAASPIVNSYLTGAVMLPYDIEGQPRDATNAPGAYAVVKP